MPLFRISSPTGRVFHDDADFDIVLKTVTIPKDQLLAFYCSEVGTVCTFLLKPGVAGFELLVEKVSD